jgi:hypothetical protein
MLDDVADSVKVATARYASTARKTLCERRYRSPAVLSQAGAPLSWTSERSEGGRQRLNSASLSERSEQPIESERTHFLSANDDEVGGSIARCASTTHKKLCERRYRAPAVLRRSERTRFLSANDDEVGGSIARCASRASKKIVNNETATIRGRFP